MLDIDSVVRTFKDGRKQLTAVADVSLSLAQGRDLRPGRRVGQRQDDAGQVRHRPHPGRLRHHHLRGRRAQVHGQQALPGRPARHPDGVPEPGLHAQPRLEHARRSSRAPCASWAAAKEGSVRAKVDKLVRRRARRAAVPLPAAHGALRRPEAAHRHRARLRRRPDLVICDEPASALDVSVQASILNLLVELQTKEQASYVFISHDLAVVRYISDRIGVMYLAELIEVGAAADVFSPPHHPYTEALLSSIPRLDFEKQRERIPLRGSMPSLSDPPSGCRFHTRCHRFLGDICARAGAAGDGRRQRAHVQVPHPAGRAARAAAGGRAGAEPERAGRRLTRAERRSGGPMRRERLRRLRRGEHRHHLLRRNADH